MMVPAAEALAARAACFVACPATVPIAGCLEGVVGSHAFGLVCGPHGCLCVNSNQER